MRNEKLFEKIKQTALNEMPDVEEWNPENVWAKVERKEDNRKTMLWLPYAAASLLLIAGIWFSIDKVDQPMNSRKGNVVRSGAMKSEVQIKPKAGNPEVAALKKRISTPFTHKQQVSQNARIAFKDTLVGPDNLANNATSPTEMDTAEIPEITVNPPSITQKPEEKLIEKVLIADIAFPEQKPVELTGLQKMFDLARREREARKMRIRLIDSRKESGFWSFVQHSFVENPSVPQPRHLPQKQ